MLLGELFWLKISDGNVPGVVEIRLRTDTAAPMITKG
jgi:hypothetical protein